MPQIKQMHVANKMPLDPDTTLPRWIDEFHGALVDSIPEWQRGLARALPYALRLAPTEGVPFSQVFNNQVTLGAPLLVSEAIPGLAAHRVREAARAHFFAIVEAFATDRLLDGQVRSTGELQALLDQIRAARDRALEGVISGSPVVLNYSQAQRRTNAAIRSERAVLAQGLGVSLDHYEAVSAGKQAVGMPAALALAQAGNLGPRRTAVLERSLLSVWLGLQEHDDVVDWQDDAKLQGAWAVCLARGPAARCRLHPARSSVEAVHDSGVLPILLNRSRWHFHSAAKRSALLGANQLADWCRGKEKELGELASLEDRRPGYVLRARVLSALRHEVGFS